MPHCLETHIAKAVCKHVLAVQGSEVLKGFALLRTSILFIRHSKEPVRIRCRASADPGGMCSLAVEWWLSGPVDPGRRVTCLGEKVSLTNSKHTEGSRAGFPNDEPLFWYVGAESESEKNLINAVCLSVCLSI
jgi:hypothetical protein